MSEKLVQLVQLRFDMIHRQMLLHGPRDIETAYLSGKMMGYRDTLNQYEIEVDGVSGKWWFEHKQGESFKKFMVHYRNEMTKTEIKVFNLGFEKGSKEIIELKLAR